LVITTIPAGPLSPDNSLASSLRDKVVASDGTIAHAKSSLAAQPSETPAVILSLSESAKAASAAKGFAEVTTEARASLDANLNKLKASGHALGFGENQGTQSDIDTAFSGLDRRSLYAIASNSGGLFSKDEQAFAQSVMSQQQAHAMGLNDVSGFTHDPSAGFLSGIRFLDSVSPEEKASDNWRVNRAGLQASYESNFRSDHSDSVAENVDSGDPVVNMLVKVIHDTKGTWSSTTDGSYVTDVSKITLLADGKHDAALRHARTQSNQ
jgi:hypothetical protein